MTSKKNMPPAYGDPSGPSIVAVHLNKSSPLGPALIVSSGFAAKKFFRSISERVIRGVVDLYMLQRHSEVQINQNSFSFSGKLTFEVF